MQTNTSKLTMTAKIPEEKSADKARAYETEEE
jgi:hypothetical protein